MNTDFPKDKYGCEIPRCHYVSAIGSQCNAPPMTGEHFCYSHNPRIAAERLEAQRAGGRNRRQPEPPPRIPPNLPLVQFESRGHILVLYEATINFVLQGQMDLRVANTIGYLAQGALMTLDSEERSKRQAALDAERAAEKAQKAEREAQAAARAEKEADRADHASGWPVPPNTCLMPNKYGRQQLFRGKVDFVTPDGHTETYHASGKGLEFISSTTNRPPTLAPDGSLNATAATTKAQAPGGVTPQASPNSTAAKAYEVPPPATAPAKQEKPKRDRYQATETEPPEIPTY